MNTLRTTLFLLFLFCFSISKGQGKLFDKSQLPVKKTYDPASIIDSTYGIVIYEKLNMLLSGDSTRNCNGYSCNGWIEDFYNNGTLLHKGYYQNGQLRMYKNYYPNGQVERSFKAVDDYKSNMKLYYDSGVLKSEVDYTEGAPIKWTDYYPNGKVEFTEEYNKRGEYYLSKKTFYENGNPETLLELLNSKKKVYTSKEFFETGLVREEGEVIFNTDILDYQRNGSWKIYNASGQLQAEQLYIMGKLNSETSIK